eukprot:TRINITY_DN23294_c0_g1_i1.p1 TRINITY_DN23294_c0_g1~~TRINITY_DN23294_c0_g1_i1.p1  ORF type:complete len:137 (-),score=12.12 TRINITY_DN23294_c0_g1_i1:387-797(-)
MVILLISFLTVVNCEYGRPFTAFHPAQRDFVQNQSKQSFVQSFHPLKHIDNVGSIQQKLQNPQEDIGLIEATIKPDYRIEPQTIIGLAQNQQSIHQQQSTVHPAIRNHVQNQSQLSFSSSLDSRTYCGFKIAKGSK